ncbi:MAG: hypothetical protein FWE56_04210, partial [Candidatus Bathyarchaeota archaeon]|nr:hypothetical protein [Candidatus Termiticorpusculum sp.]MCL2868735.1 hypothetical protein [Candidatus Termiticorpusculum sp.]
GGASYESSMSFMVNCGVDGFCTACTLIGTSENRNKLDNIKNVNVTVKNLFRLVIFSLICLVK